MQFVFSSIYWSGCSGEVISKGCNLWHYFFPLNSDFPPIASLLFCHDPWLVTVSKFVWVLLLLKCHIAIFLAYLLLAIYTCQQSATYSSLELCDWTRNLDLGGCRCAQWGWLAAATLSDVEGVCKKEHLSVLQLALGFLEVGWIIVPAGYDSAAQPELCLESPLQGRLLLLVNSQQ